MFKKLVFCWHLEGQSESISQRHESADPDPHQNVMDPQHCTCRAGWRTWPPSCWRRRTRSLTSSASPTRAAHSRTRSTSSARPATRSGWFFWMTYSGSGSYLSSTVFRIRILLVKYGIPDPDPTCQVFWIRILLVNFKYSGSGSYLLSIPDPDPTCQVFRIPDPTCQSFPDPGSYGTCQSLPDPGSYLPKFSYPEHVTCVIVLWNRIQSDPSCRTQTVF